MRNRLSAVFSIAIVLVFGLVVLLGYFLDFEPLQGMRDLVLRWAVALAGVALLVGVANLLAVHWRKVTHQQPGSIYSAVLIFFLLITLVVAGAFGPTDPWALWIFKYIQVPVESSLMAVLAVVLVYAGARILSRRVNLFTLIFAGTVLVVLIGTATLPGLEIPGLSEFRAWISQVPAAAGARGILLGVALGTVATGLRVLMGADRPYGG